MIVFPCHVCRTDLSADDGHVGQLVKCPRCQTVLRVPASPDDPAAALAAMHAGAGGPATADTTYGIHGGPANSPAGQPGGGYPAPYTTYPPPGATAPAASSASMIAGGAYAQNRPTGRRYGFNCGFCSSRLEATESMAAQEGQCPTCGNTITIPILDRYGRLIDPKTRQIIKQDPHPVHAYAAAGDRAPGIIRQKDGKQSIRCPRCAGMSAITANNCKACGMPFTMEGTTLEAAGSSNGFAVASLVLGIIGIPASCAVIPPVLAVVFGDHRADADQPGERRRRREGDGRGRHRARGDRVPDLADDRVEVVRAAVKHPPHRVSFYCRIAGDSPSPPSRSRDHGRLQDHLPERKDIRRAGRDRQHQLLR
jgi:uncharacterized C2H2 Zn-finger protein